MLGARPVNFSVKGVCARVVSVDLKLFSGISESYPIGNLLVSNVCDKKDN